jgi:hypothetical protein
MPNSDFNDNGPSSETSGTNQTSAALAGAATGAAAGSAVPVIGTAVGAVVGGVIGYFSAPKKAVYKPINVDAIVNEARTGYAQNYQNSIALENRYDPTSGAARAATNQNLLTLAQGKTTGQQARNSLLADITSGKSNSLYNESSDSILQQLRLGGQLDPETQALITRSALAQSGGAGIAGSGAARGLVARDLGLTSMGLLNARQQAAANQSTLGLNRFQTGLQAAGQDAQTTQMLASVFQARGLPTSGLDPLIPAQLRVANTLGQNKIDLASLLQENKSSSKNVSSVLGLGKSLYGAYGGGGGGDDNGGGLSMASV